MPSMFLYYQFPLRNADGVEYDAKLFVQDVTVVPRGKNLFGKHFQ